MRFVVPVSDRDPASRVRAIGALCRAARNERSLPFTNAIARATQPDAVGSRRQHAQARRLPRERRPRPDVRHLPGRGRASSSTLRSVRPRVRRSTSRCCPTTARALSASRSTPPRCPIRMSWSSASERDSRRFSASAARTAPCGCRSATVRSPRPVRRPTASTVTGRSARGTPEPTRRLLPLHRGRHHAHAHCVVRDLRRSGARVRTSAAAIADKLRVGPARTARRCGSFRSSSGRRSGPTTHISAWSITSVTRPSHHPGVTQS